MQVANILRLLFSADAVDREAGAIVASGLGLVEPLNRHLEQNAYEMSRDAYKYYTIDNTAGLTKHFSDTLANYRNAILELSKLMPKPYINRQRQIFIHSKNVTFKYTSMQCRETPKDTASLNYQLLAWYSDYLLYLWE
jgi:hypothetical protein